MLNFFVCAVVLLQMGILACFGLPNVRQLQRQLAEQRASNKSLEQQVGALRSLVLYS